MHKSPFTIRNCCSKNKKSARKTKTTELRYPIYENVPACYCAQIFQHKKLKIQFFPNWITLEFFSLE